MKLPRLRYVLPVLGGVTVLVACIPDPKGDYDDFKERTAGLGPTTEVPDAAPIDAKPPEQAVEQTYAGICVTALVQRDPAQALRIYTESKYTPDGAGTTTGKLTLTVTFMRGWETTPAPGKAIVPASFAKSEVRGDPITIPDIPVSATGRFTAVLGTVFLSEEANSLSGRKAQIDGTTLDGVFGTDNFCSTLGGSLVVPYAYEFNPAENTCVFFKAKEGDPFPQADAKLFTCAFQK